MPKFEIHGMEEVVGSIATRSTNPINNLKAPPLGDFVAFSSPYTDPFLVTALLSIKLPLFPQMKIELSQQFSCDLSREILAGALDLV